MGLFWSGRAGLGVEALARARACFGERMEKVGKESPELELQKKGEGVSARQNRLSAGNLEPVIRHHGQLWHQGHIQGPYKNARLNARLP